MANVLLHMHNKTGYLNDKNILKNYLKETFFLKESIALFDIF